VLTDSPEGTHRIVLFATEQQFEKLMRPVSMDPIGGRDTCR
jgi:hypothetical protein